ncbi:MAG TPA: trypsin-like peptidase domain-containing protein [Ktedonobacterales bacterium]|nr:trypsin-like peptidase domain-containing protein [Ktedonobacterales bacterium]
MLITPAPRQQPPDATRPNDQRLSTSAQRLAGSGQVPLRTGKQRSIRVTLAGLATLAALCLVLAGCNGSSSPKARASSTVAVPASASDLEQTVVSVIANVQPSVVEVVSQGGQGEAIGSGEILSKDGYIVTNDHVVDGFSTFHVVLSTGQQLPAQLVGKSPQDDLAVVKVSGPNLHAITVGDSAKARVGQFAVALGSPLGLAESATFGIVSALNRTASEAPNGPAGTLTGLIQTSAPINPGNSGGALVNLQGQLIGIPTLGAVDPNTGSGANGIGFAIPSNRMTYVTQQLIAHGHLVSSGQGFLGISGQDVTPQLAAAYNLPAQSGVIVSGFANDATGSSPAQAAGIKTGDIITAVNGQAVANNGDLSAALISQAPGTQVTVTVQRGSSQQQIKVKLGERPPNG